MWERTFVMIKPDGMEDPEILQTILAELLSGPTIQLDEEYPMKIVQLTEEQLREQHSKYLQPGNEASFFPDTVKYMTRTPVLLLPLKGENVQNRVLLWAGATRPWKAEEGTIRARFGKMEPTETGSVENVVHVYNPEDGYPPEVEIKRFFGTNKT